jgi:hypothetical protein
LFDVEPLPLIGVDAKAPPSAELDVFPARIDRRGIRGCAEGLEVARPTREVVLELRLEL